MVTGRSISWPPGGGYGAGGFDVENAVMDLPLDLPISPMLAKSVPDLPAVDAVEGGLLYEPKWDGFRCLVLRDGDEIELTSRGKKPLTRYFPELVDAVREYLPSRIILDTEVVVRTGHKGAERLHWEALSQRIHPAASRIAKLSVQTPAEIIAFDVLALGDQALLDYPFSQRRSLLHKIFSGLDAGAPIHLTRATGSVDEAREWFRQFEGAGLDGIVAKAREGAYTPGKRTMLKIKHKRTAEAVVIGYRVHKSGQGVGSLLLGLYDDGGSLFGVGGIAAFTAKRRLELIGELDEFVVRGDDGSPIPAETDRSRFSGNKDVSFIPLRPKRVVEVAFDQLEGHRFRHAVTFLRWRLDRDPASCTLAQIDVAPAYDLGQVLTM